jgi:CheY-like chemotaxis protein
MDVFMPGCGGIEAAKMILKLTGTEKPFIVGCSADTTEITQKKCLAVGMSSFINKPLNRQVIASLRTKVLNLKDV